MDDDFKIYEPKKFFEDFVRRSYAEYLAHPLDHYCTKMVVSNLDVIAERMWHFYKDRDPK